MEAAKVHPDEAVIDSGRQSLEKLLSGLSPSLKDKRIFAELTESIGELWLGRPKKQPLWDHIQRARPYLAAARKWWLQNRKEPNRDARFLRLFWLSQRESLPEWQLPLDEIREALALGRSNDESAHLHLLSAKALASGVAHKPDDVIREYEAGLGVGATRWRQPLLFSFASFMKYCGRQEPTAGGRSECRPDYDRALDLFQQLKEDITRRGSDSTYYVDEEIARIAAPEVRPWIPAFFVPGDPIEFTVSTKNVKRYELALFHLDFPGEFQPEGNPEGVEFRWINTLALDGRTPLRRWTKEVDSTGHEQTQQTIRLDPLPAGAYVLKVRSAGGENRSPLVVSDISLLLTRAGGRSALFVTRARDGAAVENADVRVFRNEGITGWLPPSVHSVAHGLLVLPDRELDGLVVATQGSSIATLRTRPPKKPDAPVLDVQAFTEKTLYRQGEEVGLSFVAGVRNGFVTARPGATLTYEVRVSEAIVASATASLDGQGLGHTSFQLPSDAAPGIYKVRFPALDQGEPTPEQLLFRVATRPPQDLQVEVAPSAFWTERLGGPLLNVRVKVEKDGKPVRDAFLELTIVKRTFEPAQRGRRIDHLTQTHWKSLTATTDSSGEANVGFPAQAIPNCNFEYEIEVVACGTGGQRGFGRGRVRAGMTPSFATLSLNRSVARPGEAVIARITASDADGNPIVADGYLTARREVWTESWRSPDGREIHGDELRRLRARSGPFPPPTQEKPGWKPLEQPWSFERIFSIPVKTNAGGKATVSVPTQSVGRLDLRFESRSDASRGGDFGRTTLPRNSQFPSGGEETLWVIDDAVEDSGYQPETVEIHFSKETAWPGEEVTALLATHLRNRDVLLTVSNNTGTEHSIVHVDGNVKTFRLNFPKDGSERLSVAAAIVSEGLVFQCQRDVVLDPDARRLHVEASPSQRTPRGGLLTLRLTDYRGLPARGKISAVLLEGEDEPMQDPLTDLLKVRLFFPSRETSLEQRPMAGSRFGAGGPIQPQCGRLKDWLFGEHHDMSCEPTFTESRRYDLGALSSLEADVARVLFRQDGLLTDGKGEVTIELPPCPPISVCRLRVRAAGSGYTFGVLDEDLASNGGHPSDDTPP